MARPQKKGLDYSTRWNPQRNTMSKIKSNDRKIAYKAFRNSSSAYIKKNKVKETVCSLHPNGCAICGCGENMQIDHIKSVLQCFNDFDIRYCNSIQNLQLLCSKCNSSKTPLDHE